MDKSSVVILIALAAVFFFVFMPRSGEGKASERLAYWQRAIETDIPDETPKEKAVSWARGHGMEYVDHDVDKMSIMLESVTGLGFIPFFCPEWRVVAEFRLDTFDRVTGKSYRKESMCH